MVTYTKINDCLMKYLCDYLGDKSLKNVINVITAWIIE